MTIESTPPRADAAPAYMLRDRSTLIGAAVTAAYLVGMIFLVALRWGDFLKLGLNELGDFLAGLFGPIAFLWLILGYMQQGRELRLNSDALNLQAQELANSVEQQKEMTVVAKKQLDQLLENHRANIKLDIDQFPDRGDSPNISRARIIVSNIGYRCTDMSIFIPSASISILPHHFEPQEDRYPVLEANQKIERVYFFPTSTDISQSSIRISFKDGTGEQIQKHYTLISVAGGLYLNEFGAW